MGFHELINAFKIRLSKQMTLKAKVSFDTFGKELGLFGVNFGIMPKYPIQVVECSERTALSCLEPVCLCSQVT